MNNHLLPWDCCTALLLPEILFSKWRLCKQRNDLLWKSPGGSRIVHVHIDRNNCLLDINFALTERLRTSNVRKVFQQELNFWNAFMERKIDQSSVIISPRHFRLSYMYFLGKPRYFKRDFFCLFQLFDPLGTPSEEQCVRQMTNIITWKTRPPQALLSAFDNFTLPSSMQCIARFPVTKLGCNCTDAECNHQAVSVAFISQTLVKAQNQIS